MGVRDRIREWATGKQATLCNWKNGAGGFNPENQEANAEQSIEIRAKNCETNSIESCTFQLNYVKIDSTSKSHRCKTHNMLVIHWWCCFFFGSFRAHKTPRRVNPLNGGLHVNMRESLVGGVHAFIDTSCVWRARKLKSINLSSVKWIFIVPQQQKISASIKRSSSSSSRSSNKQIEFIYSRHLLDYCCIFHWKNWSFIIFQFKPQVAGVYNKPSFFPLSLSHIFFVELFFSIFSLPFIWCFNWIKRLILMNATCDCGVIKISNR